MNKNIAIGLLGTVLDAGFAENRWQRWRPSVALCQYKDLPIHEYHILYARKHTRLADKVIGDILHVSPGTEVLPHQVDFDDPWDFEEVFGVLLDFSETIDFNPEENEYLIHITTGTHVAQICLFLLTECRYFPGKLLQTIPGKKEDRDNVGSCAIIDLDLSKYDQIARRFDQDTDDDISFLKSGIETRSETFNRLIERIEQVAAKSKDPILLTGPTGAGKSLLAGRIYDLKKIRGQLKGRFVEVNCATIRGDAAMSALFGHKKGSFTGASSDREGLLKSADGGMVFLDEVGELGVDEQAMLLRAIEEKMFMPFGSDRETTSDFQLICGTNKNLRKEVKEGRFRDDLLARINLWTFDLPGLKDRREDIEPNIKYELNRYTQKKGKHITFNKEAWNHFLAFALSPDSKWSANFRDLNGAVTRMCTLAPGGRITEEVQEEEIERLRARWQVDEEDVPAGDGLETILGPERLKEIDPFDRVQLAEVIRVCKRSGSLSEAGRYLFSVSRLGKKQPNDADRLKKYLERFGLAWSQCA